MTIGKKLFLGIGILVALTLALGTTALDSMFRIGTAVNTTLALSVHSSPSLTPSTVPTPT